MNNTWSKAINIALFVILGLVIGWHMADTEKTQDRLKRMEVSVAVCGDVAAYFSTDEIAEGIQDEIIAGKRMEKRVVKR